MVVAASGVQLPAAQVQDRGQRRGARPRGDPGARHRPAGRPRRRGRAGLYRLCRRRPRAHAVHRPQGARLPAGARPPRLYRGDPARLQSRGPARQQVQGAHQDPDAREDPRDAESRDRGRVRGARQNPARPAGGRGRAGRRLLRPARARSEAAPQRPRRAAQGQGLALQELLRRQRHGPQGARLRRRHRVAESRSARRPATPAPTSSTPSPTSPRTIPTTRSGCRTSRT